MSVNNQLKLVFVASAYLVFSLLSCDQNSSKKTANQQLGPKDNSTNEPKTFVTKPGFIDHPFKYDVSISKNEPDSFNSLKLDSLFHNKKGRYFVPDIVGTNFEKYSVTVVSCLNTKRTLLLFYDKKEFLRDTITITYSQTFSLNALLENNKSGVCIGEYDQEMNYFHIQQIYALNNFIKLQKADSKRIIDCTLPQEYLSEENPELGDTFTFGFRKSSE
jgi:hypothetical protein